MPREVTAIDFTCVLALSIVRLMLVYSMIFRSNFVHVFQLKLATCFVLLLGGVLLLWLISTNLMIHVRFCKLQPRFLLFTFLLIL